MKQGVSAVILAAGSSNRMGNINKLLAHWQGMALVRHVAETANKSVAAEVVVVTGHDADNVRHALDGVEVRFAHNPRFGEGMSTSLGVGIGAVGDEKTGAAILLGDMPRLKIETLNQLLSRFIETDGQSICAPVCGGRRGNPVIWPREFFPDLQGLSGDKGARELIVKYKNRVIEVPCDDEGVLIDVDTPEDIN
ncbi:MAG: nucleotidyltransferase family protein [Rhodospirillales bacterium]|nr:nucleotidyltransferase family protein [Rhodospirillales bacterium]